MFLQMLTLTRINVIAASTDTIVMVVPMENTAKIGETFTIHIAIIDVTNLFGLEVALDWDEKILQLTKADLLLGVESHPNGVLHEPVYNETVSEPGKYQIIATSVGVETPSFNGSGNIVRMTFNVTKGGSSELNLTVKLVDKPQPGRVAALITHTTKNGSFNTLWSNRNWLYDVLPVTFAVITTLVIGILVYHKRKNLRKIVTRSRF